MTLKKLFYWFWSTLVLGAVLAVLLGELVHVVLGREIFGSPTQLLLSGSTFAAVSQLGFFSYLVFHWLSSGLIRNTSLYDALQVLLVLVVLGNLVYLNIAKFGGTFLFVHLLIPLLILAAGLAVAWLKAKWTNRSGFIPALFFMVVATTLEAIPSINSKAGELPVAFIFFTVIILLACNSWQILQLHRWVKKPESKKVSTAGSTQG
ncbi:KinB-signaling pathway activation protein [Paenactinomyces guangxiensis]|uniref:KinB-signaling pathway activation protein n=1 Tax=Paenactinomyces guangxiensis TaxID=1490290 RepID=A0A7W1WV66_9BACL|nr:KinB-signaling pathway activation protein [Paenactinomyces guangxiensis]MBA4496573.1 KinB-signaling pathway activation protein [Paenactinomyces guangxiensis]MBH8593697.1 KinB-signaling pathway activation protein [Paenactinomyces guangxiensis]